MKLLKPILALSLLYFGVGCAEEETTFSQLAEEKSFVQTDPDGQFTKIDILWVIDNSGSMEPAQQNLADNFNSFIAKFQEKNFDFRIAVTVTDAFRGKYQSNDTLANFRDGADGNFSGVFVITPDTPEITNTFITNILQGTDGYGDERAFESMVDALEDPDNAGFVREDSFFSVIVVSDEDDFSRTSGSYVGRDYDDPLLYEVDYFNTYLETMTESAGDTRRFNVNAMTIADAECRDYLNDLPDQPPGYYRDRIIGLRHMELAEMTDGVVGNLCGDFADDLELISENIARLSTQFYLDRTPDPATIEVKIDGTVVPNKDINPGPTVGGWTYIVDSNSIQFSGDWIPEQGAVIDVKFDTLTLEN